MVFKSERSKKRCYGLLLVLFIIFGFSFVGCSDVNAYDYYTNNPHVGFTTKVYNSVNQQMVQNVSSGTPPFTVLTRPQTESINYLVGMTIHAIDTSSFTYNDYTTLYIDFQLEIVGGDGLYNYFPNVPVSSKIYAYDNGTTTSNNCSLSTYVTNKYYQYHCAVSVPQNSSPDYIYLDVGDTLATSAPFSPIAGIPSYDTGYNTRINLNFLGYGYDSSVSQTNSYLNTLTQQNETIISQNNTIINNNQEFYEHEYDAIDNIENQSSNDIDVGTGNYTNLLGLLQGFLVMLETPRMLNCELTLPFPEYAGGTVVVNPCSFKEKAPAIIQWGSSLLLITFFVPFAFIMLKLIYNEIRSWTNG